MKKIKLSVAALVIATNSFGQNVLSREDSSLLAKLEIENTAEDMIEWIGEDVAQGRIYQEYAETYIYNLKIIVTKARKLREIDRLNCENCDEID